MQFIKKIQTQVFSGENVKKDVVLRIKIHFICLHIGRLFGYFKSHNQLLRDLKFMFLQTIVLCLRIPVASLFKFKQSNLQFIHLLF